MSIPKNSFIDDDLISPLRSCHNCVLVLNIVLQDGAAEQYLYHSFLSSIPQLDGDFFDYIFFDECLIDCDFYQNCLSHKFYS